jgi:DNA-binding IclR family transcriptional regulator
MAELNKIMQILECIREDPREGLTNKQISEETGIALSTTYRLLQDMDECDLVYKRSYDKHYFLGSKLLQFSQSMLASGDTISLIRPYLANLHDQLGLTVFYSSFNGIYCVVMDIQGKANKDIAVEIGEIMPLHCSAAGKIVLAFLPPKDQEELLREIQLKRFTLNSPAEHLQLREQLGKAKEAGVYCNISEFHDDTNALSAPIFRKETVCGSVTVVGESSHLSQATMQSYTYRLLSTAKMISNKFSAF